MFGRADPHEVLIIGRKRPGCQAKKPAFSRDWSLRISFVGFVRLFRSSAAIARQQLTRTISDEHTGEDADEDEEQRFGELAGAHGAGDAEASPGAAQRAQPAATQDAG